MASSDSDDSSRGNRDTASPRWEGDDIVCLRNTLRPLPGIVHMRSLPRFWASLGHTTAKTLTPLSNADIHFPEKESTSYTIAATPPPGALKAAGGNHVGESQCPSRAASATGHCHTPPPSPPGLQHRRIPCRPPPGSPACLSLVVLAFPGHSLSRSSPWRDLEQGRRLCGEAHCPPELWKALEQVSGFGLHELSHLETPCLAAEPSLPPSCPQAGPLPAFQKRPSLFPDEEGLLPVDGSAQEFQLALLTAGPLHVSERWEGCCLAALQKTLEDARCCTVIFRSRTTRAETPHILLRSGAASLVWVAWDSRLTIFHKRDDTGPFRVPGTFWD
ncbi:hypothetical protein Cadr_000029862 [Camelus dromedarius]|uniref:Uncharacterized protein n=1 Tax=Camelus dromedarius TaxID=9838 RepID=A0A5N4CD87_CAMDR|nr:hypothetical protein Cadr_000029862 [Camelus dromedarius]